MKVVQICGVSFGWLLLVIFTASVPALGVQSNKLVRLFHHRGSGNAPSVELAKVTCYFSSMPQVTEIHGKESGKKSFFLPHVYVDHALDRQILAFNAMQGTDYQVLIAKGGDGVTISISCDPHKVVFDWKTFTTIRNEGALELRFFNNEYINALNKKPEYLLRLVSAPKKQRVIIDCGHGGSDFGAVGYNQLVEKEVTLDIGSSIAQLLRLTGKEVLLTRDSDITVPLDDRTTYANNVGADLLVSIHANAALNKNAAGVEVFCLPQDYYRSDNAVSFDDDVTRILGTLFLGRAGQNVALAHTIQHSILMIMKTNNQDICNRSVRKAVLQILAGSFMPAVLVEVGFVTNEIEAKKLNTKEYRYLLARGIFQGITDYLTYLV